MKKFSLLWVISIALMLGAGNSFGEMRGTGGMHGHEGYDHGPGVGERGRGERRDFHEHRYFRAYGGVIGAVPLWGEPPIYYSPPAYIEQQPPVYIDQGSGYWYYCPDPAGYYPNIQNCRRGWLRVVPDTAQQ
jgi:hypothetical protein